MIVDDTIAGGAGALVPRQTIDGLVGRRDAALSLIVEARDGLHRALDAAIEAGGSAWPGLGSEITELMMSRTRRDDFVEGARRRIDAASWRSVVQTHGFDRLMDRQALDEFRGQLDRDPPVFDVETAEATMRRLVLDADMLMRRGLANAFSRLDRRFRSHDAYSIGSRVVLDYAFGQYGQWNHHARRDDAIRDVERALMVLDGREVPDRYAGIVGAIDESRRGVHAPQASSCENEYLRVRAFANGNVHLWFKRDDLLRRVNLLLAEHYGANLADGCEDAADPLARPTSVVPRNMGWFPTPAAVAARVAGDAEVSWARPRDGEARPVLRILEPSAGEGAIASAIAAAMEGSGADAELTLVELHPGRAASLRSASFGRLPHVVFERDFLSLSPDETGLFDRVAMNPPFDRRNDVDHVAHAVSFLAPGGRLVAIMAAGVEFRQDAKSRAFMALVERMGGDVRDLPAGSFAESGTMVNACVVTLRRRT